MVAIIRNWGQRYLSNPEAVILFLMLLGIVFLMSMAGAILGPIIASTILAYLLQGLVRRLEVFDLPPRFRVYIAFFTFMALFLILSLLLFPMLWRQSVALIAELPRMLSAIQQLLMQLPQWYPTLFNDVEVSELAQLTTTEISMVGQWLLSFSLSSIPGVLSIFIYVVLVPILVFFLLRDQEPLIKYLNSFLPDERPHLQKVWHELGFKMERYVRGKGIEILVTGVVTYVVFALIGLQYAALIALLVGFSVVVPYLGALLATLLVVMAGLDQWGLQAPFFYVLTAHLIIQLLDGNLLVPMLFSEAVQLSPGSIIMAVLIFGNLWGIWGVFFAIPLAVALKTVLSNWPIAR